MGMTWASDAMSARRELTAVHSALHQDTVRFDPGPYSRSGGGFGEAFIGLGYQQQSGQDLKTQLLLFGRVRNEHGDDVPAQAAGVRQLIQAGIRLAQPRCGSQHQIRLRRPAPVNRRSCRARPARQPCRQSCPHTPTPPGLPAPRRGWARRRRDLVSCQPAPGPRPGEHRRLYSPRKRYSRIPILVNIGIEGVALG